MTQVPAAVSRAIAQLGDPMIVRILVRTVLITLGIFAALGAALWFGIRQSLATEKIAFGAEIGALVAILLTILGAWLLFRIVALAVLQFFADAVVVAVETRHYPASLGHARTLHWREELYHSARSIGRAVGVNLLALLLSIPLAITAIGPPFLFWAANGWLLGRELQDMVWLRHRKSAGDPAPLGGLERFTLGGIVAAMMIVPLLNLLAPVIGAASAAHLVHARLAHARDSSGTVHAR